MAKSTQAPTAEPTPESMIGSMEGFEFSVEDNVPIPADIKPAKAPVHPFAAQFDKMTHNSAMFVPTAYWLTNRGRTLESTSETWQRQALANAFADWKKKEAEARKNFRLVTVARKVGEDPTQGDKAGVRAWLVDSTVEKKAASST